MSVGEYYITDALYWRPTPHSPSRRLTPPGATPEQMAAKKEAHAGMVEQKIWSAACYPPCEINYLRGRELPWAVKWYRPQTGERTGTMLFATRNEALQSAPSLLRAWAALGFD